MRLSAADGKSTAFRFILVASLLLWSGSIGEPYPSSSDIEHEVQEPRESVELLDMNLVSLTDTTEIYSEVNSETSSFIEYHRTTSLPGPYEDDNDDEDEEEVLEFLRHYNTTTEVDLVFVLDRSGSVPRKKWDAIIQFVKV